jgi:hypothetical protein
MTKERLAALVAILLGSGATNLIVDIAFDNTNLCDEGIISLSKLVNVSAELQYFSLDRNRIDDMDSAFAPFHVTKVVRLHPSALFDSL